LISNSTIQKIIDYARIEEVVGDFVRLKKSGQNYKGTCPFHNEKTPSFIVNPSKNIFKCFGCGESGNPVTFIMKHEHYSYPEALKYLAVKYSISIEEDNTKEELQPEYEEKESLYALNAFAQKYFSKMLLESENGKAIAKTYLDSRGIKNKDIEKFSIGYNPDVWDAFTKHAIENGYSITLLEKAGLTVFKDTNNSYDRFKGRIIFPIQNITGRIVGFGARLIGKAENRPKYVNSPETEIYNKSKVLYGLFHAKTYISSKDNCFLVEGYTDVISMHRAGIENVVASSGTSLTTEQIRLIKRYTQNITILYDGDSAGIHASLRGMNMILEEGMNVKIVLFPEGEDPDSFSKSREAQEVRNYITNNAKDFIKFKTNLLLKEAENDPVKKASLIKEIVETIAVIPNGILRSIYIKECGTLLDISEQTLYNHLNKELRHNLNKRKPEENNYIPEITEYIAEKQTIVDLDDASYDEKELICFMIKYANEKIYFIKDNTTKKDEIRDDDKYALTIAEYYVKELIKDEIKFEDSNLQFIFDEFAMALEKNNILDENYFLNHQDNKIRSLVIDLITSPNLLSENWEKKHNIIVGTEEMQLSYFSDWYLDNYKSRKIYKLLKENSEKLKSAAEDEYKDLMSFHRKLIKINTVLAKKMNRIFIK